MEMICAARDCGSCGPTDIAGAEAVTADDVKLMGRLFRPTHDWEPGRTLAYYYRPEAEEGEAVLTSFFNKRYLVELVADGAGYRLVDRGIGRAQIDSLMEVGRVHYESAADSAQAISVYEMVTGIAPDFSMGHCRLGTRSGTRKCMCWILTCSRHRLVWSGSFILGGWGRPGLSEPGRIDG